MFCSKCGKQIADNSLFCNYCGASQKELEGKKENDKISEAKDAAKKIMKSVSDASKKKSRYVICKKCGGRIPLGEECCPYCDTSVNENPSVFDKLASFLSRFGIHANTATVKKAAIAVVLVVVAIAAVSCLFSPSYERAYTDEQIVDEALSVFNSKMKAKTGGGTESLLHYADAKDSSVEYDSDTNRYYCTLNATYSTNVLDIFGTSTTKYVVRAVYHDDGEKLILEEFEID